MDIQQIQQTAATFLESEGGQMLRLIAPGVLVVLGVWGIVRLFGSVLKTAAAAATVACFVLAFGGMPLVDDLRQMLVQTLPLLKDFFTA